MQEDKFYKVQRLISKLVMQAVWTVEQAEKAVQEFAAGASKAMLFMRHLSAVALWQWPEDSTSPAPLHHVSRFKCSSVLGHCTLSHITLHNPAVCPDGKRISRKRASAPPDFADAGVRW